MGVALSNWREKNWNVTRPSENDGTWRDLQREKLERDVTFRENNWNTTRPSGPPYVWANNFGPFIYFYPQLLCKVMSK